MAAFGEPSAGRPDVVDAGIGLTPRSRRASSSETTSPVWPGSVLLDAARRTSYPATTMAVGGTSGGAIRRGGLIAVLAVPIGFLLAGFGVAAAQDEDTNQTLGGRVQNEFEEDGEEVREGVADVRIVVETRRRHVDRRGGDRRGRRVLHRRPGGRHVQRAARHGVAAGGHHDPRGRDGGLRGRQHPGQQQHHPSVLPRRGPAPGGEQVEPVPADARQWLQAGDDHRHHVGRPVPDLRHHRTVELRPRRDGHARCVGRLGLQPKLGFVVAVACGDRGDRRHGSRRRAVRTRGVATVAAPWYEPDVDDDRVDRHRPGRPAPLPVPRRRRLRAVQPVHPATRPRSTSARSNTRRGRCGSSASPARSSSVSPCSSSRLASARRFVRFPTTPSWRRRAASTPTG